MNNSGKTLTIILIVLSVLLLSFAAIETFYYSVEKKRADALQEKIDQSKTVEAKLTEEIAQTKKQIFVLEEKNKEAEAKIEGLMDELELQQGLRDQMKIENGALKEAMDAETKAKGELQKTLADVQQKAVSLQEKLKAEEKQRMDLEIKIKELSSGEDIPSGVELEKIVVIPNQSSEGRVVSVDAENNFLIFNLGQQQGIIQDVVLSVYRNDQYLGDVKAARVQADMSVADFIAPLTSQQVQKNDRVIVKK
ncbi:MAG: hypothetical protein WC676_06965 [Candidatus Omnitrophota bacterium]